MSKYHGFTLCKNMQACDLQLCSLYYYTIHVLLSEFENIRCIHLWGPSNRVFIDGVEPQQVQVRQLWAAPNIWSIHVQNKNRTIQGCTGTSAPPYWTRSWHTTEIMAKHSGGLKGGEHRMLSQSETSALQRSAITKKRALASKTNCRWKGWTKNQTCVLAGSLLKPTQILAWQV